ncbi:T9SS type A sorting domain-containing protein [Aureispira anguillae]|uniref:T9SS type A sorting domain-containing protein n=1 Tax=Aureispira anguillae TaxID=2864201 RepID=A0A916DXD8_9BACT|nr:T9SS type A sorting domain-containing protein [Aureispira anguillae]BDS14981.1 T9SS type A sorting domain-containing protein [Aureispira anguillae]
MRILCIVSILIIYCQNIQAQILPQSRSVDWTLAGLRSDTLTGLTVFDMQTLGAVGDGLSPNDAVISNFLATYFGAGAILEFPSGQFLFNNSITLPSNFIIRGQGADSTTFLMDLGGSGHAISVQGTISSDTSRLIQTVTKGSRQLVVWNAGSLGAGDWLQLKQNDSDWITSSWAELQTGQVVQIDSLAGDTLWLVSPLRMDYDTTCQAYFQKINPQKNIGIECLKIKRIDDTAPQQGCNVLFKYAVNCWVRGIESENCTFSHIKGEQSSNLYIAESYFHHGFNYGGGGRAYGVVFQHATGECLAENNIFEHLRHSMLLQAGANGNVFAYNYSLDPYWSTSPNNSAGDMVLHGNYVYANLFEHNVCRNIVIDNSHGPNGPHNTFFRNRAEGFGIFFSASNSPDQNFLGNDITNTAFPYSLVNYTIQGSGHFVYGNNDKGSIKPAGTQTLGDFSYAYTSQPSFVPNHQWAKIGTPNVPGASGIPALDRYTSQLIFDGVCTSSPPTPIKKIVQSNADRIYPNPTSSIFNIESQKKIENVYICNELGQLVKVQALKGRFGSIKLEGLKAAVYFIKIKYEDASCSIHKVIKID